MVSDLTPGRMNPEVADTMFAAAFEWNKSGIDQKRTFWKTEDAMPSWLEDLWRATGVKGVHDEWFLG